MNEQKFPFFWRFPLLTECFPPNTVSVSELHPEPLLSLNANQTRLLSSTRHLRPESLASDIYSWRAAAKRQKTASSSGSNTTHHLESVHLRLSHVPPSFSPSSSWLSNHHVRSPSGRPHIVAMTTFSLNGPLQTDMAQIGFPAVAHYGDDSSASHRQFAFSFLMWGEAAGEQRGGRPDHSKCQRCLEWRSSDFYAPEFPHWM